MGKGYRQGRLGEEIRRIISGLIVKEIKDPIIRNSMLSISAVDVTNDGSYATVYISVLGTGKGGYADDEEKDAIIAGFNRAKGLIKREIGNKIKMRHVPELIFKIDTAMEYGTHMNEVISSLGIENYKAEDSVVPKNSDSDLEDILKDL